MGRVSWKSDAGRAVVPLVLLLALFYGGREGLFGGDAKQVVADLKNDGPNEVGLDELTKNYYAGLQETDREVNLGSGLTMWVRNLFDRRQGLTADLARKSEPIENLDGHFLFWENIRDEEVMYKGVAVRMNRFGHRDDDAYEKEKPADVFRIAVVGGSNCMAYGVEVEQGWVELLEARLNQELAGRRWRRFELINFAVVSYYLPEKLYVYKHQVRDFHPDLVLVEALAIELRGRMTDSVATRIFEKRPLEFSFFEEIARNVGIKPDHSQKKMSKLLKGQTRIMAEECFKEIARLSREYQLPTAVLALRLEIEGVHPMLKFQSQVARESGLPVLEVFDTFEGGSSDMYVHPRDYHPSFKANQLIVDELYNDLLSDPTLRPMLGAANVAESR